MEQTKKCTTCKLELPLLFFCKNKHQKDGHHRECKPCVKAYQQANKAKLQIYQQKYQAVYRTENYDKIAEYTAEWKANNIDKCNSYTKKSNAKNPQLLKNYMKMYNAKLSAKRKLLKQQND